MVYRDVSSVLFPPPTGGIDDVIAQILSLAEEQSLPTIFALSRRRLAVTLKKSHKVGCVGVFRYEGAEVSTFQRYIATPTIHVPPAHTPHRVTTNGYWNSSKMLENNTRSKRLIS